MSDSLNKRPLIYAWGLVAGHSLDFVDLQVERAEQDGAMPDALYMRIESASIRWVRLGDITSTFTLTRLKNAVAKLDKPDLLAEIETAYAAALAAGERTGRIIANAAALHDKLTEAVFVLNERSGFDTTEMQALLDLIEGKEPADADE